MKKNWFKITLLLVILLLGYLFALNGRYEIGANGKAIVDKWEQKTIKIGDWLEE